MSKQNDRTPTPSEKPGDKSGGAEHSNGPTPTGPKNTGKGAPGKIPTGAVRRG